MKRSLEEEQRARKDLEKVVRRVLKSMNDPTWDETNLWTVRSFRENRMCVCAHAPAVHRPFRFDIPQTALSLWEFGRKALVTLPSRAFRSLWARLEGETKTFSLQLLSSLLSSGTSVVLQWYSWSERPQKSLKCAVSKPLILFNVVFWICRRFRLSVLTGRLCLFFFLFVILSLSFLVSVAVLTSSHFDILPRHPRETVQISDVYCISG